MSEHRDGGRVETTRPQNKSVGCHRPTSACPPCSGARTAVKMATGGRVYDAVVLDKS